MFLLSVSTKSHKQQQQQQHEEENSNSCRSWFSNNNNLPRGRLRSGITIKGRTLSLTKTWTHIFGHQQQAHVERTILKTSRCAWVCMLPRVTLMLRVWRPTTGLLCLLILLLLLPKHQPNQAARASLLYFVHIRRNHCLPRLRSSVVRCHCDVTAVPSISFSCPSASASGIAHFSAAKELLTTDQYFSNGCRQQNSFTWSPWPFHIASCRTPLIPLLHTSFQHKLTTQTPSARVNTDREQIAAGCCWHSLAPAIDCRDNVLITVAKTTRRWYNISIAAKRYQRLSKGLPAYFAYRCPRNPTASPVSIPRTVFTDVNVTHQLRSSIQNPAAFLRVFTPGFSNIDHGVQRQHRCTGGLHKYSYIRFESVCAFTSVTWRCSTRRGKLCVPVFHELERKQRKCDWQCRSRNRDAPLLKERCERPLFLPSGGAAAIPLARTAAAAAACSSPLATTAPASIGALASVGGAEAAEGSAADGRRPFSAAAVRGVFAALSARRLRLSPLWKAATGVIRGTTLEALPPSFLSDALRSAVPVAGGSATGASTTPESVAAAIEAPARFSAAPGTPPSKKAQLSPNGASPSQPGISSYPFTRIEEKWVRYYAEHSDDFSPQLPCNEPAADDNFFAPDQSGVSASLPAPASHSITGAYLNNNDEFGSDTSHARNVCEKPRTISHLSSQPVSKKLAQGVHPHAQSPTRVQQSLRQRSQEKLEATDVEAQISGSRSECVNEAREEHTGCSTQALDDRKSHAEFAKEASFWDPRCSVDAPRSSAVCDRGKYGQHQTGKREQNEVTSAAAGAGYTTSSSQRLESAKDSDAQEQRQRDFKQANRPAGERQPEEKPNIPCATAELPTPKATHLQTTEKKESDARVAAPAERVAGEQKRKKYYVLSMIPYPSGEGLHIGHCLTYTVADVVARFKRLQLRGELLRNQKGRDEGTETEGWGEQQRGQQQLHQGDQEAGKQFPFHQESSSSELLSADEKTTFLEEPANEGSSLACDQEIQQGSCKQAHTRVRNKDEAFLRHTRTPTAAACVTSSPTVRGDSRLVCGFETPIQAGGEKGGSATLNQRQEEKYQVPLRAPQRPDVMHVMGWDAFGLPAEQHALASGIPPRLSVRKNIERFRHQLQRLGLSVDWRREIDTSDPGYFRWTQWIFLQMWKRGLVYEKAAFVNWCEALGTVLADEEVVNSVSTRGQHPVEQRRLEQWHLRISAYADELEKSLHSLDWPEDVKTMQRNWIGKRELLYLTLPLVRSGMVSCNRLLARGNRDMNRQAADAHTVNATGEPGICRSSSCNGWYVCDHLRGENASSHSGRTNGQSTFPPSQPDHGGCGATSPCTSESASRISCSGNGDREACSLRCVSLSPEFLFGVTFVVMHAANKQARTTAAIPAARAWLSVQNREPTVEEGWRCGSCSHVEANEFPSRNTHSTSTAEQTDATLDTAGTQTGTEREALVDDKHEDAVTGNSEYKQDRKLTSTFFEEEAVFSGSYVKHPLTDTALPLWLFSERLFDQLKGAGTYFNHHDVLLVVPEDDRVAEAFARASGLPIINVLAPRAEKKWASNIGTQIAGGSEFVRQHDKHYAFPDEGGGDAVDGPLQDVIVNSQSAELTVSGLNRLRARRHIVEHLVSRHIGEQTSRYALRDWVFSRQRFWGEPIPLIRAYAADGRPSVLAESETNLPVVLPEMMYRRRVASHKRCRSALERVGHTASPDSSLGGKNALQAEDQLRRSDEGPDAPEDDSRRYLHHGSLMAPLADYPQWWNLTPRNIPTTVTAMTQSSLPTGGHTAVTATECEAEKTEEQHVVVELQREVSTMPQWAGSSWYFLRFLDPHNVDEVFNKESARHWMPVDLYVGGKEHAVTHLLYARFWHKVLRDLGLVTCDEPFKRLCTPGIMLGTPEYAAFQRLDTGEWVSASSVSLKKGNLPESHVSQEPSKSNDCAEQRIKPVTACSTTNFEIGIPVSIKTGHHDSASSTAKHMMTKATVDIPSTAQETAGMPHSTPIKSASQHDTVAGVHRPSGQPVREVRLKRAAVTQLKGSDVPVLKEDETIEVMCRYEKMSKSRGNVISPDNLIQAYGADALRLHLLFMGPVEARKVWSLDGIKGVSRFLNRVWHLVASGNKAGVPQACHGPPVPGEDSSSSFSVLTAGVDKGQSAEVKFKGGASEESSRLCTGGHTLPVPTHYGNSPTADGPGETQPPNFTLGSEDCSQLQNAQLSAFETTLLKQLIERVTRHVERLSFNTALAALMCAVRKLSQWKVEGNALSVHTALILVRLLHPFAPFITEELWFRIHERFPNISTYASSPSLLACGVWPTDQDTEMNTHESPNNALNTTRKCAPRNGSAPVSEMAVNVCVYFDGKLHLKMQVPAAFVTDKCALEEYVKHDARVAKIYADKKVVCSVVLLKEKIVNFVTRSVSSMRDERKKRK